jgi:PKD repeat protein
MKKNKLFILITLLIAVIIFSIAATSNQDRVITPATTTVTTAANAGESETMQKTTSLTTEKEPTSETTTEEVTSETTAEIAAKMQTVYNAYGQKKLNLKEMSNIPTKGAFDVVVSNNYAYIADWEEGLIIVDITSPQNPVRVSTFNAQSAGQPGKWGAVYAIALKNNYVYLTTHTGEFVVIDVSNPRIPKVVGFYKDKSQPFNGITINGNYAYIANGSEGLYIFDITYPNPIRVGIVDTSFIAFEVEVSGNHAFLTGGGRIWVVDISKPSNPVLIGSAPVYLSEGVAVSPDGYVYVTDFYGGLHVIDFTNLSKPVETNSVATLPEGFNIVIADSYLYIANGDKGISIFDISSSENPEKICSFETNSKRGQARNVFVKGDYVYLASGRGGLIIFKLVPEVNILVATPLFYTIEGLTYLLQCKTGFISEVGNVKWDFGDGEAANGVVVTHTYKPGNYIAKATIYNSDNTNFVQKEIAIVSKFPDLSASASPLKGDTALNVDFKCDLLSTNLTDSGLKYQWKIGTEVISEQKSFSNVFVVPGTYTVKLEVTDPASKFVKEQSFNIKVNPITFIFSDEGRKIQTSSPIFVDPKYEGDSRFDPDKDGINQAWEDAAMKKVAPYFELDEGESWLTKQYTSNHKVANFIRVTPYTSVSGTEYILFYYCIAWSRDYGRYINKEYSDINIFEAHNGDTEKVILAWKVINDKKLELAWVYTSAHGDMSSGHSGVWKATEETTNWGNISTFWGAVLTTEEMHGTLEFYKNALKLYTSQDKHANYPSISVGENIHLAWIPIPPPGWFVMEDVGGGPILRFDCYNAGEPGEPLMDDIRFMFPDERIWSGNINDPGVFAGGLGVTNNCPGTIGQILSQLPDILKEKLDAVIEES